MKRAATFLVVIGASTLTSASALAIETGPPNLPPPPPPPLTAAPPSSAPPRASRPAASPPPAPASGSASGSAPVGPSYSASSSASADTGTSSSDSGMHALDTRWFIAPMIGYLSDYLDFGIGVRAGKVLDNHVYIGGTFVYQFGESQSGTVAAPLGPVTNYSWSTGGFYVGPEGGYDFDLRYVVVRPYMGLGIFDYTGSATSGGVTVSQSGTKFVVWPGCSVLWNVPNSNFFIGGDVRIVSVPNAAVGFYAMGGLHLGS